MHRGYSLIEVMAALTVVATTVSVAAPAAKEYTDLTAVVAARESVVGVFARARVEAIARGGATVRVVADPPAVSLTAGGAMRAAYTIEGVSLDLGGRPEVELTYDALGIGRVASVTVRLSRGRVERRLVVSSFGRVRRP